MPQPPGPEPDAGGPPGGPLSKRGCAATSAVSTYQTLYRKYRSQTFSDLVGQEAIVRALQGAIASDRLAHAYLFSGSRGTGACGPAPGNTLKPERSVPMKRSSGLRSPYCRRKASMRSG